MNKGTNRIASKSEARCENRSGCVNAAEVTVTNGAVTIRVCPTHTWTYSRNPALTVTPDADANVSICPTCRRCIGHKAHAAHNCYGA